MKILKKLLNDILWMQVYIVIPVIVLACIAAFTYDRWPEKTWGTLAISAFILYGILTLLAKKFWK